MYYAYRNKHTLGTGTGIRLLLLWVGTQAYNVNLLGCMPYCLIPYVCMYNMIEMITCPCIPEVMQVHRYNGLLKLAFQIVSKDQKNKDVIDPVIYMDLHEVESLFEKCDLLIKKVVDQNTQELSADR